MSTNNVVAGGENLVDQEAMLEMLHAIIPGFPNEVKVEDSIVYAEDHGMASRLYKVTLSASGEAKEEWDGKKMCVKWFDASKFLGDDWRLSMRELLFYRDFADEIAEVIHIPHCYGAQKSGNTISCVAFEFVEPPYQLGEQVAGMPLDEMEATVKLIAKLHSRSIEDLPDWVLPVSKTVAAVEGVIRGAVKNIKPENVRRGLNGVDPEAACKVLAQVCAPGAWESIADLVGEGFPKHLIHFDVRGENLFIKRSEDGSRVEDLILFDWQNIAIGSSAMELAYFLPGSMTIPMRREHEKYLIFLYVDELQRHLGPEVELPTKEEYWARYKLALSYVLVWASIILDNPDGVMEMIGKTEEKLKAKVMNFMITTAERNLTAVIDHGSADLLTAAIAAREAARKP